MDITQAMIDQSAKEESAILAQSPAVLIAQNEHLNNRVVVLRALVNEQQKELEKLKAKPARKAPADRRPKKSAAVRAVPDKE